MDNKNIFATNLKRFMAHHNKTRKEICNDLGFSYFTFSDWVNGKKYPRMDKVEMLADYFGVLKSDLIEEKTKEHKEMQMNNGIITDAVVKMRMNDEFLSVVESLLSLDDDKLNGVKLMLDAFKK